MYVVLTFTELVLAAKKCGSDGPEHTCRVQKMASSPLPPFKRAGKTVPKRVAPPSIPEDTKFSSDDGDDSDDSQKEDAMNMSMDTSQQSSAGDPLQGDAAPEPPEEFRDDLDPEQVTLANLKNWTEPNVLKVNINHLRWDYNTKWGQIRPLNDQLVQKYVGQLKANLPRVPVRVLLRSLGTGMHSTPFRRSLHNLHFHRGQVCGDWGPTHIQGGQDCVPGEDDPAVQ